MINVINVNTNEVIKVDLICNYDGTLAARKLNPEPGTKFYTSYPFIIKTDDTIEVEGASKPCRVVTLAEGYELKTGRSPRKSKATKDTVAEVVEEVVEKVVEQPVAGEINPEVEVRELDGEPVEVIKVEEVTEEPVTVDEPVTAKAPAKSAGRTASSKGVKRAEKEMKVDTPPLDAATQAFAALTPLFAGVQANVTAAVMNEIEPLISKVEAVCGRAPQIIKHVIKTDKGEVTSEAGEVFHANFDDICNRIARGSWVYLFGPTGSGKNVMAEQIARALGLEFHYQAHTLDRFELTGFIDANGHYQPTEFYKAYTEGGLFMLDELDGSDENALITLNSASNGYFAFPCGTVKAHPNFRCIAAGNTCGRGGTDDYTARRVMDISSLGRFIPRFHNYCNEIDMAAANNDVELVDFVHTLRRIKKDTGCQIIASPRQIKEIVKDEAQGLNLTQTLSDMFGTYLTADELNIVKESLRNDDCMSDNKYAKAFKKVQAIEY